MTELVTSGSVGGMASNGCLYPEVATLFTDRLVLSPMLRRALVKRKQGWHEQQYQYCGETRSEGDGGGHGDEDLACSEVSNSIGDKPSIVYTGPDSYGPV